jgi:hypothetical protein
MRNKNMLKNISKTVGSAMAALCLVSTLAMAQSQSQSPSQQQPQYMTCTKDDGKGNCTAATRADGKEIVVVGEGVAKGARMTCVDTGNAVNCKAATT